MEAGGLKESERSTTESGQYSRHKSGRSESTESKRFQSNESGRSQSTDFFFRKLTFFTSCFTLESECESDHEEAFVSEIIF